MIGGEQPITDIPFPVIDAQQLYKQWQDGKLLNQDERKALRFAEPPASVTGSFADVLKSTTERDS